MRKIYPLSNRKADNLISIERPCVYENEDNAFLKAKIHISDNAVKEYINRTKELTNCLWRTYENYPPREWKADNSCLWFATNKTLKEYLCDERSDAFVMIMLWYAMLTESDISFEIPMSERLYNGLTKSLIPKLCGAERRHIKLIGPLTSEPVKNAGKVGTGMPCGVDSFYTMRTHNLTHLTYFEAGHIHHMNGVLDGNCDLNTFYGAANAYAMTEYAKSRAVAEHENLEFVSVMSNADRDYYRGGIIYTSMYRNLSCVLALQKLFSEFISSSSGDSYDVETKLIAPSQHYENLICDSCKTEALDYYTSDFIRRYNKLEKLADDLLFRKYATVCFNFTGKSCGECYGCLKTMVPLDEMGKLKGFGDIFDLDKYYSDRKKYIKILANGAKQPQLSAIKESWLDIVKHADACEDKELKSIIEELNDNSE